MPKRAVLYKPDFGNDNGFSPEFVQDVSDSLSLFSMHRTHAEAPAHVAVAAGAIPVRLRERG